MRIARKTLIHVYGAPAYLFSIHIQPYLRLVIYDAALSHLDELMSQSSKNALSNTKNSAVITQQQKIWITTKRNTCTDAKCIGQAYAERIADLNKPAAGVESAIDIRPGKIILGRCHMNMCWWWKIEKTEVVQAEENKRLIKVVTSSTSTEYTDSQIEKHGYPKNPPKGSPWGDTGEVYVFCSAKLPAVIVFDSDKNAYVGTIPFMDRDGTTAGATEGIGNLYLSTCNNGKRTHFTFNPDSFGEDIILYKPTAIFNH